jgi:hypothetical protein
MNSRRPCPSCGEIHLCKYDLPFCVSCDPAGVRRHYQVMCRKKKGEKRVVVGNRVLWKKKFERPRACCLSCRTEFELNRKTQIRHQCQEEINLFRVNWHRAKKGLAPLSTTKPVADKRKVIFINPKTGCQLVRAPESVPRCGDDERFFACNFRNLCFEAISRTAVGSWRTI